MSLSARFARTVSRLVDSFAAAVGHIIRWVLLGMICLFVLLPGSALLVLFRRQSTQRLRGFDRGGWTQRIDLGPTASSRRGFGAEPTTTHRLGVPRLSTAVTVLVALVCVDVAGGAFLTGAQILPPIDRGDIYRIEHADPESGVDLGQPGVPWIPQYVDELTTFQSEGYEYVPFLIQRTHEFHSRYLNTTDEERVSYEPVFADGVRPLRVAFFGASVMFGFGQRDAHTPASEFARIAEHEGIPVEVHNFGFPRMVLWQEFQLLERVLARGESFDLIVFLDGFNEFYVQAEEGLSPEPTHHAAGALGEFIADFRDQRATSPGAIDGLRELASTYRRNSAIGRLWDRATRKVARLPGADRFTGTPEQQADAALGIYGRARSCVTDLADTYRTPVRFFWQPQLPGWPAEILDRLPPDVIDLSHVDEGHKDDYFDIVHTNEEGARVLAEGMWDRLGADLSRLAATN